MADFVSGTIERTAVALSYLWELAALPFHAGRLAALRLASHRASYELALGMAQELATLREAIRVARQMERELEDMDLALDSSRRLAVKALAAAIERLEQRVAASFPEEPGTPGEAR